MPAPKKRGMPIGLPTRQTTGSAHTKDNYGSARSAPSNAKLQGNGSGPPINRKTMPPKPTPKPYESMPPKSQASFLSGTKGNIASSGRRSGGRTTGGFNSGSGREADFGKRGNPGAGAEYTPPGKGWAPGDRWGPGPNDIIGSPPTRTTGGKITGRTAQRKKVTKRRR